LSAPLFSYSFRYLVIVTVKEQILSSVLLPKRILFFSFFDKKKSFGKENVPIGNFLFSLSRLRSGYTFERKAGTIRVTRKNIETNRFILLRTVRLVPSKQGQVVFVENWKGGVGKTALSFYLAALGKTMSKKVLVVDLDPSSSMTLRCDTNLEYYGLHATGEMLLSGRIPFSFTTKFGFDLVPGDASIDRLTMSMPVAPNDLVPMIYPIIDAWRSGYDLVVVDTSPRPGSIEMSVLACSDTVFIPTSFDAGSIYAIVHIVNLAVSCIKAFASGHLVVPGAHRTLGPYALFLAPWGIDIANKECQVILEELSSLGNSCDGIYMIPPFPKITGCTDALFACGSIQEFLAALSPGKRKVVAEYGNVVAEVLTRIDRELRSNSA
jgi:cellulose biosynthesis protein BcsQ